MTSSRPDKRGHWTPGKRRSSVSPTLWEALRGRIAAMLADAPRPGIRSLRAIGERLGVDQRTVKRWLDGVDFPGPDAMAALRAWHAEQRRALDAALEGSRPLEWRPGFFVVQKTARPR